MREFFLAPTSPPPCRSPCSSVSLACVSSSSYYSRCRRGICGGSRQGKTARVTLLPGLSSHRGQGHGHDQGQVPAPPGAGKVAEVSSSSSSSSPAIAGCVRVSAHAQASVNILVNASRAIDIYYVMHIDYILYIGGLRPRSTCIGGRSHLRVSTATKAARGPRVSSPAACRLPPPSSMILMVFREMGIKN